MSQYAADAALSLSTVQQLLEAADGEVGSLTSLLSTANSDKDAAILERDAAVKEAERVQGLLTECTGTAAELRRQLRNCRRNLAACKEAQEPDPEPEPNALPGGIVTGKVQYGWDVEGQLSRVMGQEIQRLSNIEPARDRTPQWCHKYAAIGENQFNEGQDGYWAASRGINVFINLSFFTPSAAAKCNNGDYDDWIRALGRRWTFLGNEFGVVFGWAVGNEMDAPDKEWDTTAAGRLAFRRGGMRIANLLAEVGCVNQFQASPPSIAQLYHGSGSTSDGGKFWAEYVPQLKEGVDWREWPDRYNPPKEAFDYTFPWMLGINQYCWHGMAGYGNYNPASGVWTWDQAQYERHTVMNDVESKHGHLASVVAKALGVPILISEWGNPIKETRQATDAAGTVKFFLKQHEEFKAKGVAVAIMWKQVLESDDADVKTSALAMHGRHAQQSETNTKGWPDPNNCRCKGLAAVMDLARSGS